MINQMVLFSVTSNRPCTHSGAWQWVSQKQYKIDMWLLLIT